MTSNHLKKEISSKNTIINNFTGPLFIVGMPRSGTKLLRELLNMHPSIGIPEIETNFLPTWKKKWENYGDLSDPKNFNKFYNSTIKNSYFMYKKDNNELIKENIWYNNCYNFNVQGIFEALIRHDTKIEFGSNKIWGDKSPLYLQHLNLLKRLFPNSKIIHIIRDVRDYCLSIKNAWGKNMIRAAQRWSNDIQYAQKIGNEYPGEYIEIKYEELVMEPIKILKKICDFIDIEFTERMIKLNKPAENLGAAKNVNYIKKNNIMKYRQYMSANTKKKIEEITYDVLKNNGYEVEYSGELKKISNIKMIFYKILDWINLLRFDFAQRGIKKGFIWNMKSIKVHLQRY